MRGVRPREPMVWKIERWLAEVFPGEARIYEEYRDLPPRELAIVSVAVLDAALAELLALRLADYGKEAEDFLGVDGDGRAPAGSFGARIQLGLLTGLLTPEDAALLRAMKELRNLFAHRVRVTFLSPAVVKVTKRLHALWLARVEGIIKAGAPPGNLARLKDVGRHLQHEAEAGEGLLLAVFTVYQAYFHRMHSRVTRIDAALHPAKVMADVFH